MQLIARLVGTINGRRGRLLGESETWALEVDEPPVPRQSGTMKMVWVDFQGDESESYLRPYSGEPFYLDLYGDVPVLWLNSGFEGLPQLLPTRAQLRGAQRGLQEAVRVSIAKSVWIALFHGAVASLPEADDEEEPPMPSEGSWQLPVLKRLLPLVYPEMDETTALKQLCIDCRDGVQMGAVLSRAVAAIGHNLLREGRSLGRAIDSITNTQAGVSEVA